MAALPDKAARPVLGGGTRVTRFPTAIASSSLPPSRPRSLHRTHSGHSDLAAGTGLHAPTRPVPCAARKGRFGVRNGRPSVRADRSRIRWLKLKHPQRVLAVAVGIGVRIAAHATTSGFLPSYREADRLRPFNNAARGSTQRLQRRDRLAHDPSAALGQGDQILTQPVDVLLHRQATNFAVTIPEPDARPVAPKELSLNRQRRVAGPAADPDNTSYGSPYQLGILIKNRNVTGTSALFARCVSLGVSRERRRPAVGSRSPSPPRRRLVRGGLRHRRMHLIRWSPP